MPWLLIVLLLCPFALDAQKRPPAKSRSAAVAPAPKGFPVESIAIDGNKNYSRDQVLRIAGLKIGQIGTDKEFAAARDRLAACGAFDSVEMKFGPGPDKKGYVIEFRLSEAGPFFPVKFENLGIPDAQLTDTLKAADPLFGPSIPATKPFLNRYSQALQRLLAERNHNEPVWAGLVPDLSGNLAVVFRPNRPEPKVAVVKFVNNQVLPNTTLSNTFSAVAVGRPWSEPLIRQLLDTSVRPLYESRGRVKLSFPEIQAEKAKDVDGLVLTIKVDEGASYDVGEIRAEGAGMTPEDVNKIANIKKGDIFNVEEINAGVGRVEQALRHDGFMKVKSRVDRDIREKTKTVNLLLHFDRGPQYNFGQLAIEGLDIQTEPFVRKMWVLKPGKPFNADYPNYFLDRLHEDGVFEKLGKTKAVLKPDDEKQIVDVTLVFSPLPKETPVKREF
jgi:outer membrane protein insertion porin family